MSSIKKILKTLLWAGSIFIGFMFSWAFFSIILTNDKKAQMPIRDMPVGLLIMIVGWVLSIYILTNFLKDTRLDD